MGTLFDPISEQGLQGMAPATDDPESDLGDVFTADAKIQAIDANYWHMRQRRILDEKTANLDEMSQALYGTPDAWRQAPEPDAPSFGFGTTIGQVAFEGTETGEFADRQRGKRNSDAGMQRMFDQIGELQNAGVGEFANFPTSLDEMDEQVNERVSTALQEERAEAEYRSTNRSVKTVAGGIAGFAGSAVGAMTDIEGVALLPLGFGAPTLGRAILWESFLGGASEAATLPAYNKQADFLERPRPDPLMTIAFGATFGAALPLAGRGAKVGLNTLTPAGRVENAELLRFGRRKDATPEERGAAQALGREEATQDTAPEGVNEDEHSARVDDAEAQMAANQPVQVTPAETVPTQGSQSAPGITRQVLDFIRSIEAPGGYDQVYSGIAPQHLPPRPITQMSINDVLAWQDSIDRLYNSEAAGGYQMMEDTLRDLFPRMGLTGNELFDGAMQDRMAIHLMRDAGLDDFLTGRVGADSFGNRLAGIWAGLPQVSGAGAGRSVYEGTNGNHALASASTFMSILTTPGSFRALGDDAGASGIRTFRPGDLRTDAISYQYKDGGDDYGVTDRLQFEKEWDPNAAEVIMVHERSDGDLYVVDGHQRLGLARRLSGQGVEGIELIARVYREDDGFRVPQIRAMAALKNIRQESGTPADAAKLIRDHPELTDSISRSRTFMDQAEGLAKLHPGPFQAMINGVVPQNYGGLIGRIIPDDEEMQAVAMATIAKDAPPNADQAASMIHDIRRMGLERKADDAQGSLFGDGFDLAETIIRERAAVLDATMKELRRDKTVFARLSRESARIEGAGNVLNKEANISQQQGAENAIRALLLADQNPAIRDALDAAARAYRSGTRLGDAAQSVIDAITGADAGRNRPDRSGAAAPRVADDGDAPADGGSESLAATGPALAEPDLFGDPLESRGALAQVAQIETDMRARLAAGPDGDMDVPIGEATKDGPASTEKLSDLMADIDDEANFLAEFQTCMPKGVSNGA